MKKNMSTLVFFLLISGCSYIPPEVFTNKHECTYIGCETGGLIFYPHERPEDKNEDGENYEL